MKKSMLLLTLALLLGVLSACGNAGSTNSGTDHADHDSHGAAHDAVQGEAAPADEDAHADDHGDHGGAAAAEPGDLKATFAFANGTARANEETELTIEIANERGERVTDFEVSHEKLLHLIIVDHDLNYFSHIHPDFQEDGTFRIATTFPAGGEYKLFADVVPTGGASATLSEWVKVEGPEGEHADVAADSTLLKAADGKEVELSVSSVKANEDVTLTFDIRDAATKEGINDLQPYLGAVGHVVILSADAERYIHVHPLDESSSGPKAQFATAFPEPGTYKIWGQFQHNGEVFTVPYVIDVK